MPGLKMKKTGRGNYFPLPLILHAERYVLHAGETHAQNEVKQREKKSYLARWRRCLAGIGCFAGGAVVEADGGVVALRMVAPSGGATVQTAEREISSSFPLLYQILPPPLVH